MIGRYSPRKKYFYEMCQKLSIKEDDINKIWRFHREEIKCAYGRGYNACKEKYAKIGATQKGSI